MFAVHRQHRHALAARGGHHGFAGHDEDFLAGHGDVFPRLDRRQRGPQSAGADDGDEDEIGLGQRGEFDEALDTVRAARDGEFGVGKFLGRGVEFVGVGMGGHPDDFHPLGDVACDFPRALADGTGGPEDDDAAFPHGTESLAQRHKGAKG